MNRFKLIYIALFACIGLSAQIDPNLILGLTKATTAEMNAIVGSYEGSLLYNTDIKGLYVFNGTAWVKANNDNWLLTGNAAAPGTSFLGTTNDTPMDLRTNNISALQLGRRQTLGLVQAYPDYTDGNQYITYLKGNNGISVLQFQADGANFYKPMFFTNSDGNFRLKGSAAGTDLFEIGSAGTANNGEVEFIIGDDGAEPFIFKRYDYRDQLLKELMRIQGSSDAQNAKPRVGIATSALANSTLQINGSLSTATITPNSNITLDESHYTVLINSNISVTLPAANSASGRIYVIKNTTNAARTISTYINAAGVNATQINAQTTLWLQSNGTNWNSVSSSDSQTITNLSQNTGTGLISYLNENNATQTAKVVSTDGNNTIKAGSDGGAYANIYEKIVIWAEDSGSLATNSTNWGFGDSGIGQLGIPMPEAWEIYAVSFSSIDSQNGDSVTMAVIDSRTNTTLYTFVATGPADNIAYTQVLAVPVAVPAGTSIGFRTVLENGNVKKARVAVFLRRKP